MAGHKNPADVFYWNDWDNAPDLRSCSLAAQGLWMRCLCIARRSPEPGFVLVLGQPSGRQDLADVLSGQVGKPPETLVPLIDELITSGTASVDRKGRIYCRRMVRAAAISHERSKAGKAGAAATHGKVGDNSGLPGKTSGKQPSKPPDKQVASSRLPPSALPATPLQDSIPASYPKPCPDLPSHEAKNAGFNGHDARLLAQPQPRHKRRDRANRDVAAALEADKKLKMSRVEAWQTVFAACDPADPNHEEAVAKCVQISRAKHLGWFPDE